MAETKKTIIEKLPDMTLEECIEVLYNYPPNSHEFSQIHHRMEHLMTDSKYDDKVFVFKSQLHRLKDDRVYALNRVRGISSVNNDVAVSTRSISIGYDEDEEFYFSSDQTFLEDKSFDVFARRLMEYEPTFKQLVVAAYITDGTDILLLKTNGSDENRIKDKYTLIQGHVDFSSDAYILSQADFLLENIRREVLEELSFPNDRLTDDLTIAPKYYINDNTNHVGLEHFGIVYEIRTDSVYELAKKLESGEAAKHNIHCSRIKYLDENRDQMDNWTKLVFSKLV